MLRLISLFSVVNSGIKSSVFDSLINAYGVELLFTLDNLEQAGLFKPKEGTSTWQTIQKAFNLLSDSASSPSMALRDIDYVFSCYAPLSVRLVQLAIKPGWVESLQLLKVHS